MKIRNIMLSVLFFVVLTAFGCASDGYYYGGSEYYSGPYGYDGYYGDYGYYPFFYGEGDVIDCGEVFEEFAKMCYFYCSIVCQFFVGICWDGELSCGVAVGAGDDEVFSRFS